MSRAVPRPLCHHWRKLGMFLHMKSYIYTQIKDHSFQRTHIRYGSTKKKKTLRVGHDIIAFCTKKPMG
ncbi:uncharacterized protein IAS62_005272 [Cryptococcus decagattii]|uniref:Uncharacterized protein n=1 Tax=Cryptococcus decagattii TaxID=1859122 RepID=A0ABZ2B0G2_9TREE